MILSNRTPENWNFVTGKMFTLLFIYQLLLLISDDYSGNKQLTGEECLYGSLISDFIG
jgi:hypothetical protein